MLNKELLLAPQESGVGVGTLTVHVTGDNTGSTYVVYADGKDEKRWIGRGQTGTLSRGVPIVEIHHFADARIANMNDIIKSLERVFKTVTDDYVRFTALDPYTYAENISITVDQRL